MSDNTSMLQASKPGAGALYASPHTSNASPQHWHVEPVLSATHNKAAPITSCDGNGIDVCAVLRFLLLVDGTLQDYFFPAEPIQLASDLASFPGGLGTRLASDPVRITRQGIGVERYPNKI